MAKKQTKPKADVEQPITYGQFKFKPRNATQERAWQEIANNDYTFLTGCAGAGKTLIPLAYAVQALLEKNSRYDKIILSRPAVEAGEQLGFLPGSASEKMRPFLAPVFEAIDKIAKDNEALKAKIMACVEIVPLAHARGRNFERAFCVLDEAQNTEAESIEMFMTRLCDGSKMVLCGDDGQPDIARCVLGDVAEAFYREGQAGWCQFTEKDVVRHPRIAAVIRLMAQFKKPITRRVR